MTDCVQMETMGLDSSLRWNDNEYGHAILAKARIQKKAIMTKHVYIVGACSKSRGAWFPAFAGMTGYRSLRWKDGLGE